MFREKIQKFSFVSRKLFCEISYKAKKRKRSEISRKFDWQCEICMLCKMKTEIIWFLIEIKMFNHIHVLQQQQLCKK